MRLAALCAVLALPLSALAQADEPPPPEPSAPSEAAPPADAPAPGASAALTAEQIAQLQTRLQALEGEVDFQSERLASLEAAQQQNERQQAEVEALRLRGAQIEAARLARIRLADASLYQAWETELQIVEGSSSVDDRLAALDAELEALRQNAAVMSGGLEYGNFVDATTSLRTARQALAEGDYFRARSFLLDAATYARLGRDAAASNPTRAWSGQ